MASDDGNDCPLCMDPLEMDDINFFPCDCSYQICRFCWTKIINEENGLCPACRQPYNSEHPASFKPMSNEELFRLKKERKKKEQQKRTKTVSESRKHLADIRVVQDNLIYVVGIPMRLSTEISLLSSSEYFGKYGKVYKIVVNHNNTFSGPQGQQSVNAYVTYRKSDDAMRAIQDLNKRLIDGRQLKVSLGTTKYCSQFLRGAGCTKSECMYLHEYGNEGASFTKEDMQQGRHTEYEQMLIMNYLNSIESQSSSHNHSVQNGGFVSASPADSPTNFATSFSKPNDTMSSGIEGLSLPRSNEENVPSNTFYPTTSASNTQLSKEPHGIHTVSSSVSSTQPNRYPLVNAPVSGQSDTPYQSTMLSYGTENGFREENDWSNGHDLRVLNSQLLHKYNTEDISPHYLPYGLLQSQASPTNVSPSVLPSGHMPRWDNVPTSSSNNHTSSSQTQSVNSTFSHGNPTSLCHNSQQHSSVWPPNNKSSFSQSAPTDNHNQNGYSMDALKHSSQLRYNLQPELHDRDLPGHNLNNRFNGEYNHSGPTTCSYKNHNQADDDAATYDFDPFRESQEGLAEEMESEKQSMMNQLQSQLFQHRQHQLSLALQQQQQQMAAGFCAPSSQLSHSTQTPPPPGYGMHPFFFQSPNKSSSQYPSSMMSSTASSRANTNSQDMSFSSSPLSSSNPVNQSLLASHRLNLLYQQNYGNQSNFSKQQNNEDLNMHELQNALRSILPFTNVSVSNDPSESKNQLYGCSSLPTSVAEGSSAFNVMDDPAVLFSGQFLRNSGTRDEYLQNGFSASSVSISGMEQSQNNAWSNSLPPGLDLSMVNGGSMFPNSQNHQAPGSLLQSRVYSNSFQL